MFRPEDLIQDEIEHPDQTRQLQQTYTPSQADQQSVLRIRTRLLEHRSASIPTEAHAEEIQTGPPRDLFNERFEHPAVGQFLQPPVTQPSRQKRKAVNTWRFVALIAALCVVMLSGMWYPLTYAPMPAGHPMPPRVAPTTVAGQNPSLFDLSTIKMDIKMTSATIGWAREEVFSSARGFLTIARTADGGKTWQGFDFQGQPAGLLGYFFLDDQTAWVVMGSSLDAHTSVPLMRTTDGGQHWTTLHMPPLMTNITFLDQKHGWAWSTGALPWVQESSTLYKTVDGGTTWVKLGMLSTNRVLDDPAPGPLPFNSGLTMTFLTPQHGWATIYPSQNAQRALLYVTQDGGRTWQLQHLPQPATGPIPGIHTTIQGSHQSGAFVTMGTPKFFTPLHGVFSIVSQRSAQRPRELYVYETSDGGEHWSPLGTKVEGTSRSQAFMVDPTHLLVADEQTITVYVLVYGQWQEQASSHVVGVRSLSFVNGQLGWAYADQRSGNQLIGTLYTTSDGGKSWHKVMQDIMTQSPNPQGG